MKPSGGIEIEAPKVAIYLSQYAQMQRLIELSAPNEISGIGLVEVLDEALVITDIIYCGGIHSPGNTNITENVMDYMVELEKKGELEKNKLIHCWWHSHGSGPTFWSGTDEATMAREVCDKWQISIVANTHQDFRCRVSIYKPIHMHFDNLPLFVYNGKGDKMSSDEAINEADEMFNRFKRLGGVTQLFSSVKNAFIPDRTPSQMPGYNPRSRVSTTETGGLPTSLLPPEKSEELALLGGSSLRDLGSLGSMTERKVLTPPPPPSHPVVPDLVEPEVPIVLEEALNEEVKTGEAEAIKAPAEPAEANSEPGKK